MEVKAKSKRMADLKAFLEQERERLIAEIGHGDVTTDQGRAGYGNHMAEDATAVFEQARNVGQRRDQQRMLADVEDALRRIVDKSYGTCCKCGSQIDTARLRVVPATRLCLVCQQRAEKR